MGRRKGDWKCKREGCHRMNVEFRDSCERCGRDKKYQAKLDALAVVSEQKEKSE